MGRIRSGYGRQSSCRRRFALERLECRALLSGDIALRLADGHLMIFGDESDNALALSAGSQPGEVLISGLNGTTIQGQAAVSVPVTKNVHIKLGAGADVLNIGGEESHESGAEAVSSEADEHEEEPRFSLPGDLIVDTGEGNDRVTIRFTTFAGSIRLDTGAGEDIVTLGRGPTFRDPHGEDGGHERGDEAVTFASASTAGEEDDCGGESGPPPDVTIGGSARIDTGSGDDRVKVAFSSVGQSLTILTREGEDIIVTGRGPVAGEHGGGGGTTGGDGGCGGEEGHEDLTVALATEDEGHEGGRPPDLRIGSTLKVETGKADDVLMIRNTSTGRLDVDTGADADALGIQKVTVTSATTIDAKQGDDLIVILGSSFEDDFKLQTGTGYDKVYVKGTSFGGRASFSASSEVGMLAVMPASLVSLLKVSKLRTDLNALEIKSIWDQALEALGGYLQGHA